MIVENDIATVNNGRMKFKIFHELETALSYESEHERSLFHLIYNENDDAVKIVKNRNYPFDIFELCLKYTINNLKSKGELYVPIQRCQWYSDRHTCLIILKSLSVYESCIEDIAIMERIFCDYKDENHEIAIIHIYKDGKSDIMFSKRYRMHYGDCKGNVHYIGVPYV